VKSGKHESCAERVANEQGEEHMTNEEFEPIRIRIMQEAYDLADKDDPEGYNSVKVMCGDVQNLLQRTWVGLTGAEVNHIFAANVGYPERMMKEVERLLKEKNYG